MAVAVETTIGDFTIDLYTDERPRTCMNFIKLCKQKYYNHNLIFSIERNFIAQLGDPTATGKGGASVFSFLFGDKGRFYEGEKIPILKHKKIGLVSMASCGKNLYGSQFFITLGENLDSLDKEHLIFGEVTEGFEALLKLNQTLVNDNNRPYQDIRVTHTVILEDPFPDPEGLQYPDSSPDLTEDILESDYIAVNEQIDDTEGKTMEEIQEEIEQKESEARATILEMVGDLPDADMAPPENVLFVCKLNPVTTSEDLEIIFSRFGMIKSCEVISDRITGNSLQYAFIEFAEQKSCEDAYFKMDNVLIDDRRIHVDFSQSVSKIRWKGKGRGVEYLDEKGKKNSKEEFNPNKTEPRRHEYDKKNSYRYREKSDQNKANFYKQATRKEETYHREENYVSYHSRERQHSIMTHQSRNKDRYGDKFRERNHPTTWDKSSYLPESQQHKYVDDRYRQDRPERDRPLDKKRHHTSHSDRRHSQSPIQSDSSNSPSDSMEQARRQKLLQRLKKDLKKKKRKNKDSSDSEKKRRKKKKKYDSYTSSDSSDSEARKKKKKNKKQKKIVISSDSTSSHSDRHRKKKKRDKT